MGLAFINGKYQEVAGGSTASYGSSEGKGLLWLIAAIEFSIAGLILAAIFVKGTITALINGCGLFTSLIDGGMMSLFYPFLIFTVMGIFHVTLPRILGALLTMFAMPVICFFLLVIFLPAAGTWCNGEVEWSDLSQTEKSSILAKESQSKLDFAKQYWKEHPPENDVIKQIAKEDIASLERQTFEAVNRTQKTKTDHEKWVSSLSWWAKPFAPD